jgi:hypothetical protein
MVRIFHEIRSSFATRIQEKAASQGPTVAGVQNAIFASLAGVASTLKDYLIG